MAEVAAPDAGPAPERTETKAETRKVVRGVLRKASEDRLAAPDGLTDRQRRVLAFGNSVFNADDPRMPEIKKKVPDAEGTDLLMAERSGTDADGKPFFWKAGEVRISAVNGLDEDGRILVGFNKVSDDSDDSPVTDSSGARLELSISRGEFFDTQVASEEAIYRGLVTGKAQEVVAAEMQVLQHERGKGSLPTTFPSDADVQVVKEEYDVQEDTKIEQEPRTPLERADTTITEQIAVLEEELRRNPPGEKYQDKEAREKAQKLLFTLRVAAVAKGDAGVIVKSYALQQMHDSPFELGDFVGQVADLANDEMEANTMMKIHIEELIHDPESGIKKDKDIQDLLNIFEKDGILAFIQDKRVQKLTAITEPIFGNNFKSEVIGQLIKASKLSPEKKAELEKHLASGKDKEQLLLILLMLISAPVIAAAGASIGAVELAGSLNRR